MSTNESFTREFIERELHRTNPDFVVYVPKCSNDGLDHGNEHVHVFRARDGRLCALWTMSQYEGFFSQRAVISFSFDNGATWTAPTELPHGKINPENGENMASWAAPLISRSGRIYVIYNKHQAIDANAGATKGIMAVLYSDDCGETWSEEAIIPMPRSVVDPTDSRRSPDWCVWQKPYRLSDGSVIMGFSRGWLNDAVPTPPHPEIWVEHPCGCEFFRIDNLDEDPEPQNLRLTFLNLEPEKSLTAPLKGETDKFCGEEPAVCPLPDGRLFCVFRTAEGHVWYSVSDDSAVSWRKPEMLRYYDGGPGIKHPLSPSPMFEISSGEYVLFTHNHDGFYGKDRPQVDGNWRNPLFILKGEFRADAHQPVWFSQPVEFMNNGDVALARKDLAMYCDMTIEDSTPVLWYPDRKFFVLGRRIPRGLLATLQVPKN